MTPDDSSSICPVCGNVMRDGICPQCRANQSTRSKKWRTGDHGGKRPERSQAESSPQPQGRLLSQALNGTWHSLQRDVQITINTRTSTYRSTHPKKPDETFHRFFLVEETGRRLRFLKDDSPISVRVDDDGIVRMKSGNMQLGFIYVQEGIEMRTCPSCFAKIPTSIIFCDECDWCFGSAWE